MSREHSDAVVFSGLLAVCFKGAVDGHVDLKTLHKAVLRLDPVPSDVPVDVPSATCPPESGLPLEPTRSDVPVARPAVSNECSFEIAVKESHRQRHEVPC